MKINLNLENPYPMWNLISHSVFLVIDVHGDDSMDFYILGHFAEKRFFSVDFDYSVLVLREYARKRNVD